MKTYKIYNSPVILRELSMLEIIKPGDYANIKRNSWNLGYGFVKLSDNSMNIGRRVHATLSREELGIHFFRPIP